MDDTFTYLNTLLLDRILPNLRLILASQDEQRILSDELAHNFAEFRSEITIHFAQVRADIAACRAQLEDVMVTLRDLELGQATIQTRKSTIH
jgi:hypothetical protein